jgi:hypothetical protein
MLVGMLPSMGPRGPSDCADDELEAVGAEWTEIGDEVILDTVEAGIAD